MKKNSIFIVVVVLSATLVSCSKENRPESPVSNTSSIAPPSAMPTRVKIVSGWLVLPLSNFDYNNAHSLQARYTLASPAEYDYNTHVQLAYARRKGRDSYVYDRLPASFNTSRGNVQVGFDLNQTSFTINIWNTDFPDQRPAKEQFEKMEYRFIVIPKSTYLGLHIDWNDYAAVASALNLPVSSSFISQLP